ncbi:MAG: alpha/beta fold hydrolase [Anaerolineae bacterium]|nr:alpha/beta fold hydrolase [Anaerolineae bacterium]
MPTFRKRLVRYLIAIALSLAFFVLLGAGVLLKLEAKILTTVWRRPITGSPLDINLAFQDVTIPTADGLELSAWYVPGSRPEAIILVHGIHANKQEMLIIAPILTQAGYPVLMLDLRGHGESDDSRLSYGYRESLDVQAAADYLLRLPEVERVGAMGYSLGGAAVARAAGQDERIEAVVIQSSFSSLPDAVNDSFDKYTGLPKWPLAPIVVKAAELEVDMSIEQVDSARDLASLSPRPVLIIHGQNDDLFPVHQAHKMYAAARQPKSLWVVEGLGHHYQLAQTPEYQQRLRQFFAEAFTD